MPAMMLSFKRYKPAYCWRSIAGQAVGSGQSGACGTWGTDSPALA